MANEEKGKTAAPRAAQASETTGEPMAAPSSGQVLTEQLTAENAQLQAQAADPVARAKEATERRDQAVAANERRQDEERQAAREQRAEARKAAQARRRQFGREQLVDLHNQTVLGQGVGNVLPGRGYEVQPTEATALPKGRDYHGAVTAEDVHPNEWPILAYRGDKGGPSVPGQQIDQNGVATGRTYHFVHGGATLVHPDDAAAFLEHERLAFEELQEEDLIGGRPDLAAALAAADDDE